LFCYHLYNSFSIPFILAEPAGIECVVIIDKHKATIPKMEAISIGPLIKNPHCPDEKAHIGSVKVSWDFLLGMLKEL